MYTVDIFLKIIPDTEGKFRNPTKYYYNSWIQEYYQCTAHYVSHHNYLLVNQEKCQQMY